MTNSSFWNKRFLQFGHTGLNNSLIYGIEQYNRSRMLRNIVLSLKLQSPNLSILDFGCGTASLGVSLARSTNFSYYTGYDVSSLCISSAKRKHTSSKISLNFTTSHEYLLDSFYDVIIGVTVLQHMSTEEITSFFSSFKCNADHQPFFILLDNCYGIDSTSSYINTSLDSNQRSAYLESLSGLTIKTIDHYSASLLLYEYVFFPSNGTENIFTRFIKSLFSKLIKLFLFIPAVVHDLLDLKMFSPLYTWFLLY